MQQKVHSESVHVGAAVGHVAQKREEVVEWEIHLAGLLALHNVHGVGDCDGAGAVGCDSVESVWFKQSECVGIELVVGEFGDAIVKLRRDVKRQPKTLGIQVQDSTDML